MTNGDKIRNMSDREWAKELNNLPIGACNDTLICDVCIHNNYCGGGRNCEDGIFKWLQQEVKSNEYNSNNQTDM